MCVCVSQRMQLDIILTSLQDHTHVASLLGYSSPADGPEGLPSGTGFTASPDPTYGATAGHPDTHLAEILMKTLLRNLGFYTVSTMFGKAPSSQSTEFAHIDLGARCSITNRLFEIILISLGLTEAGVTQEGSQ